MYLAFVCKNAVFWNNVLCQNIKMALNGLRLQLEFYAWWFWFEYYFLHKIDGIYLTIF